MKPVKEAAEEESARRHFEGCDHLSEIKKNESNRRLIEPNETYSHNSTLFHTSIHRSNGKQSEFQVSALRHQSAQSIKSVNILSSHSVSDEQLNKF